MCSTGMAYHGGAARAGLKNNCDAHLAESLFQTRSGVHEMWEWFFQTEAGENKRIQDVKKVWKQPGQVFARRISGTEKVFTKGNDKREWQCYNHI